ncbi:prosaposin-like isoform X2 [Tachysurus fulvidraco]|uniref:prosaposin-like isoform X2 n=1 Tax=Tachysurus fulvidraco TaxID=1234273 RepID=UPI001FEF69E3|nr:prosaposin-like isoform X2 [Tachysurus fulvidraco]
MIQTLCDQNQTTQQEKGLHSDFMMFLRFLLVFIAVASPLLGTEQCARGPPYWCQNAKTASLCGAVSHCQQNVWNQPHVKSVPCDLCKEVVAVVDKLVKDNSTESEVLSYLEKTCQLVPDEGLASQCKEIVDNYFPVLIDIIKGELDDPDVICSALGLCVTQQEVFAKAQLISNEIPELPLTQRINPLLLNIPQLLYPKENANKEKETTAKEGNEVCDDCVKFITDTQTAAKKNTTFIDAMIAQIESQCDLLGPGIADICRQYVSQYAPLIFQQLMSMDEVVQALEKVCSILPSTLSAQCKDLIDTYGQTIIELLIQEVDPKTVCSLLGLCRDMSRTFVQMVKAENEAAGMCGICKVFMQYAGGILERNLRIICIIMPVEYSVQCEQFIEHYEDLLIQLLQQALDPEFICTKLGACPGVQRMLLGLEQCSWGPAYWCKNMDTAIRCNAVNHCRRLVWS